MLFVRGESHIDTVDIFLGSETNMIHRRLRGFDLPPGLNSLSNYELIEESASGETVGRK